MGIVKKPLTWEMSDWPHFVRNLSWPEWGHPMDMQWCKAVLLCLPTNSLQPVVTFLPIPP